MGIVFLLKSVGPQQGNRSVSEGDNTQKARLHTPARLLVEMPNHSDQASSPNNPSIDSLFNEADPEKIGVLISALSEAELARYLEKLTLQDLAGNTGRLLFRRWAELNPAAAANWVAALSDDGLRPQLIDLVAVAWSEKDLPHALAWVKLLPEGDTKNRTLADLGYEMARGNPLEALQLASQLPAGDYADALLLHALAQYATVDSGQSQQLALALPPGALREQALSLVATVLAKQDGLGAARFAVDNIAPGPELDRAVIGVVQLWAQDNFTGASDWVQTFPNSVMRQQAEQSLDMLGMQGFRP